MSRSSRKKVAALKFADKLVLNQYMISLFGVDPLADGYGRTEKPFHKLVRYLRTTREGLDTDGRHHFFHELKDGDFFRFGPGGAKITEAELLGYEENIVRYTAEINRGRARAIQWKYFQWLALVFVEAYLDRYFRDRAGLLADLNAFVAAFNAHYDGWKPIDPYTAEDLNKICFQNATGSGKTLLLHVNLKQFRHYATKYGEWGKINFPFLITPNARLSEQHRGELVQSGIQGVPYVKDAGTLLGEFVYTLEIQKIQKEDGPETVAVRNLGDNNLLFVDEGHAGLSGAEDATWMGYREQLCEKGFAFEYSATFEQAVAGTGHEDEYAKAVLFDYAYRWFYEDGYGKDYQIYNLPKAFETVQFTYLVASLLKFYQQLRIYEEKGVSFAGFNLEKPLWVFVGSTVSAGKKLSGSDLVTATDVAEIVRFIATFLGDEARSVATMTDILLQGGAKTGLLDSEGNDIMHGAFGFLSGIMGGDAGKVKEFYRDILKRVFHGTASGKMQIERLKGGAGEILLRAPFAGEIAGDPFGLINVGSPKELCDHLKSLPDVAALATFAEDSDLGEAVFQGVRESSSPINLLVGSKKFVEGWDCWRVSTLGLMHVGKSEGSQIIQLFGRGVRLKGWDWCLKRSSHAKAPGIPQGIHELELLNVFGIEADFMQKFRDYLKAQGLPGNERRHIEKIPLNVTYDIGKKLKIVRPKKNAASGKEYDFKSDGPVPQFGDKPQYLVDNPVVADWYPRVQSLASKRGAESAAVKDEPVLGAAQIAHLDWDELYFELERFKRERSWYNFNVTRDGIARILAETDWYRLYIPAAQIAPTDIQGVRLLRDVAAELLRRYAEKLYEYRRRQFIEPRLEVRELTKDDENFPKVDDYLFNIDADDATLLSQIQHLKSELAKKKDEIVSVGNLEGIDLGLHLYRPLFHLKKQGEVTILPVALNDSEFRFVKDLCAYAKAHAEDFKKAGRELFLLRNLSRGKGVGFAEASNFHPDFILWIVDGAKQQLVFIEPHGMLHESLDSDKVKFAVCIKDIEKRLGDSDLTLESFILSPTSYQSLIWSPKPSQPDLVAKHILFLDDRTASGAAAYLDKMFKALLT